MTTFNLDTDPSLVAIRRQTMFLTPRQLFIGLVTEGFITPEEGIAAAATGALPAAVEAAIGGIPAPQQVAARITWARMGTVMRTDPLVNLLGAAEGVGPEALDAFFTTYAGV